jgi:superfamily II DNA/RNA helicase
MDMGFWPDVRRIAEALPTTASRQTMLFSATMPEEVMRFANTLAPEAVFRSRVSHPATGGFGRWRYSGRH